MRFLLLTILLCVIPAVSTAQTALESDALTHQKDDGFRLHFTSGYPSIAAIGIGWKTTGGTEFLLQGGGLALWAVLIGSAEASVTHDWLRRPWGALYAGLAASLLGTHAFVIDCYEGEEPCEDVVQTLWLTSPRLGVRVRLDRRKPAGMLPYLDLAAGPQIGWCRGSCPSGEVIVNAAVSVRALFDFQRRAR